MDDLDDRIIKIAQNYGFEVEKEKCMEEMSELSEVLLYNYSNLDEELADVLITVCELIYLCDCGDKVRFMVDAKLNRQLERIKEEENGNDEDD